MIAVVIYSEPHPNVKVHKIAIEMSNTAIEQRFCQNSESVKFVKLKRQLDLTFVRMVIYAVKLTLGAFMILIV